jgi:hypothetical protein
MSYSRRQLEALGEPFGDSATQSKPGGRIYGGGGGGGGGPSQTTTISELPEWARGYAQEGLAKAQAVSSQPFQAYGGARIAGFSPLQQQAQQAAGTLGPAAQIGQATGLAGLAGTEAFRAGQYTPGQFMAERTGTGSFTQPGMAEQYMSPYMEQAIAPQLREARRASDIQAAQIGAQAAQQGAFGGSRAAILEAERRRNLATQTGDIRARGLQSAYEQAQQLYGTEQQRGLQAQLANQQAALQAQQLGEQSRQFGAGLGLQGLGTALSAAGQLGQLGQQQFGQQQGAIGLQSQLGAQQQALRQQGLTQAYQDFLAEQNYPYKQLGFMSDLIRGLPLGQQTAQQIYAASPSPLQTIGSLGLGAYGMKQLGMFAEGGSVTDDAFVEAALDKMSDTQLAEAERAAIMRNDMKRINMIAEEKAVRASERQGLAGAFNQIPQATQERMVSAARGGILAFRNGDSVEGDDSGEDFAQRERDDLQLGAASQPEFFRAMAEATEVPTMTPEQRMAEISRTREGLQQAYGASALEPFMQDLVKQREALSGRREEGKGLMALAAAQALSSAPGLRAGIGQALGAVGTEAAKLSKDIRDSERLIQQSRLHLAQAKQAREDRMFDTASALVDRGQTEAREAARLKKDVNLKLADIASRERQAGLSREQQAELAKERSRTTLEAARISAGREPAEIQMINNIAEGLQAKDPSLSRTAARAQATQQFINERRLTDLRDYTNAIVEDELAADPTLKDDPVRLARVQRDARREAASNLRGFGQRAAISVQELIQKDPMLKGLIEQRTIQAAGSNDIAKRRVADLDRQIRERADYLNRTLAPLLSTETGAGAGASSGILPGTSGSLGLTPATGGASTATSSVAPNRTIPEEARRSAEEWLKKNPDDPRAAEIRKLLGK